MHLRQWQQAQSLLQCMQLQPADVMTCNALTLSLSISSKV